MLPPPALPVKLRAQDFLVFRFFYFIVEVIDEDNFRRDSRPHFAWQLLINAHEYLVYDNTLTLRDVDVVGKWERVQPTARLCFSPFIHCAQNSVCVTALPRCSGQFQDTEELKA